MENHINFLDLDHDIQIEIIKTLYSYSECHVECSYGIMEVKTSYALRNKYPADYWISQEFDRESLMMFVKKDWNTEWEEMTRGWEYMTPEEKHTMYCACEAMLRARAEQQLKITKYHLS